MKTVSTPPTIAEVREVVAQACATRPITKVELFGSMARGEARAESEVDLLLEFSPGAQFSLFDLGGLKEELETSLGRRVDLLSRQAVEQSKNPYRRRIILEAPLLLYAQ